MKNGTMRKKLATGLLAVTALAGGGTTASLLSAVGASASATANTALTATTGSSFVPYRLQQLVDNGTITQAQATALRNAMFSYMEKNGPPFGWFGSGNTTPPGLAANGPLTKVLAKLVKDGTFTQAQATAVTNALCARANARFANRPGGGYGSPWARGAAFTPPWAASSSSSAVS